MLDELEYKADITDQRHSFLEPEDRDRLVWIAEAGLQVESQSAFFLWSQGALQMLVPHEIMLCGIRLGHSRARSLQYIRFSSSRYFRDEHFASVCDPQDGLMSRLVARWLRSGKPCFCLPGDDGEMDNVLVQSELKNIASHGVLAPDAEPGAYFAFSRTTLLRDSRATRILELITPIVYVTFSRVLASDAVGAGNGVRVPQLVSQREVEILALIKDGKTTLHIAESLGLSPFTVKNHVQNILRKLGARTRSHAVAQAINLGLLQNW